MRQRASVVRSIIVLLSAFSCLVHACCAAQLPLAQAAVGPSKPLWSNDTAVLILDCYNGAFDFVRGAPEGETLLANLLRLEKQAQDSNALMIYTRSAFHSSGAEVAGPFGELLKRYNLNFTDGSLATTLIPELSPRAGKDLVLTKKRMAATAHSELLLLLRAQRIQNVVLAGLRSSGAVLSTAMALYDSDFWVTVVRNASLEIPLSPGAAQLHTAIFDLLLPGMGIEVL